jgi:hypothetical protein
VWRSRSWQCSSSSGRVDDSLPPPLWPRSGSWRRGSRERRAATRLPERVLCRSSGSEAVGFPDLFTSVLVRRRGLDRRRIRGRRAADVMRRRSTPGSMLFVAYGPAMTASSAIRGTNSSAGTTTRGLSSWALLLALTGISTVRPTPDSASHQRSHATVWDHSLRPVRPGGASRFRPDPRRSPAWVACSCCARSRIDERVHALSGR